MDGSGRFVSRHFKQVCTQNPGNKTQITYRINPS